MASIDRLPASRGDRRGVAQSGSASALGAEGRRFESCLPDHRTKPAVRGDCRGLRGQSTPSLVRLVVVWTLALTLTSACLSDLVLDLFAGRFGFVADIRRDILTVLPTSAAVLAATSWLKVTLTVLLASSLLTWQAPSSRSGQDQDDAHGLASFLDAQRLCRRFGSGSIPPDSIASTAVHAATFWRSCAGSILSSVSSGVW